MFLHDNHMVMCIWTDYILCVNALCMFQWQSMNSSCYFSVGHVSPRHHQFLSIMYPVGTAVVIGKLAANLGFNRIQFVLFCALYWRRNKTLQKIWWYCVNEYVFCPVASYIRDHFCCTLSKKKSCDNPPQLSDICCSKLSIYLKHLGCTEEKQKMK